MAASAGAIVGDSIGYLAGWHWGDRMFDVLGRRFPKHAGTDRLAYAEHVFTRYGVWAVFFGRFVALLRIFAGRGRRCRHRPLNGLQTADGPGGGPPRRPTEVPPRPAGSSRLTAGGARRPTR